MKVAFPLQILAAAVLGAILGPFLGTAAAPLGDAGRIVIDLLKAFAVPLVFFGILQAVMVAEWRGRLVGRFLMVALVNLCIAMAIGVTLSRLFRPGDGMMNVLLASGLSSADTGASLAAKLKDVSLATGLLGHVPTSLAKPFVDNAMLSVVFVALFVGFAFRRAQAEGLGNPEPALRFLLRATEVAISAVIRLVPIAVMLVVARVTAAHGLDAFKPLGWYFLTAATGLLLHVAIAYQAWIALYARMPLRRFWAAALEPVGFALGVASSLATVPVTLRALDKLGVSERASRLVVLVGTNLNNDGILLYEAMAVVFVAQAHGLELGLAQQISLFAIAVVAGVGISGIPEAGLISLAIVMSTVGLPLDLVPLLLTVDWALGRLRAATNVLGDLTCSIAIDAATPPRPLGP
jgi:DAACS family dicarboxylate/amino acid:cation (Na+ or H+) symporter